MKKYGFYAYSLIIVALGSLLSGCGWFSNASKTTSEDSGLKIISVNDAPIYEDAHIKGDIRIPFEYIDRLDSETAGWNKESPIVVYCTDYQCGASKIFAKKLKQLGFTDVRVYPGGIAEWYQLSKKDPRFVVEGKAQEKYLSEVKQPPSSYEPDIHVITAPELIDLIAKSTK